LNNTFTYFDAHTHKKYTDSDVEFVRNAFHHLPILQLNNIPYHFSIGIHPWDVLQNNEASIDRIKISATHPRCLAIGECGLDYYIKTDRDIQKNIFIEHIKIAEQLSKPMIIHCVRAYHDLPSILNNTKVPIILHQYTGNSIITESLLKIPTIYFSFGKQLFSQNFNSESFHLIPINRILFETDNSSKHIEDVYEKAALLFDLDFEKLILQLRANFRTIFPNQ
jgi:TatD DNase family protein